MIHSFVELLKVLTVTHKILFKTFSSPISAFEILKKAEIDICDSEHFRIGYADNDDTTICSI